jgi:uncharacterized metal-binding protein YceD (DUF177 family)
LARPVKEPWPWPLPWSDVGRNSRGLRLEADEATRAAVARALGLPAIKRLTADVTVKSWLDGAEIAGHIDAEVTQVCGVTLDPFDAPVSDDFTVRAVPAGSPHAADAAGEDALVDPEADDPPDVVRGGAIDLGGYVVEHLALALDPFPRKPGVVFDPPADTQPESPFAVLKGLKSPPPEG